MNNSETSALAEIQRLVVAHYGERIANLRLTLADSSTIEGGTRRQRIQAERRLQGTRALRITADVDGKDVRTLTLVATPEILSDPLGHDLLVQSIVGAINEAMK